MFHGNLSHILRKTTKPILPTPYWRQQGPMLFNNFINDLFYVLGDTCPLYNYADDDTLGFCHTDIDMLNSKFEEASKI